MSLYKRVVHISDLSSNMSNTADLVLATKDKPWHWGKRGLSTNSITTKLVLATQDKPWDWGKRGLSSNRSITAKLVLATKDKPWHWGHGELSKRRHITAELVLATQDKPWNWGEYGLSFNRDITRVSDLVLATLDKPWEWVRGLLQASSPLVNPIITMNIIIDQGKPSEVTVYPWLFAQGGPHVQNDGKWMLFYSRARVDDAWNQATELYASGQLPGVSSMKVATAFDNPRACDESHPIIFYGGLEDDEEYTMGIGRQIVAAMKYRGGGTYRAARFVYWKSDKQTLQGTAATGQTRNWTYRVPY